MFRLSLILVMLLCSDCLALSPEDFFVGFKVPQREVLSPQEFFVGVEQPVQDVQPAIPEKDYLPKVPDYGPGGPSGYNGPTQARSYAPVYAPMQAQACGQIPVSQEFVSFRPMRVRTGLFRRGACSSSVSMSSSVRGRWRLFPWRR